MKTSFSLLPLAAASALVLALAGCGGSSATNLSLGGTVTGLTTGNLVLANGTSTVNLPANGGGQYAFAFPARIAFGAGYNVVVQSQPDTLTCTIANGIGVSGTSDVTNVTVTCVANNNLGGTVTGLTTSGLVLANGSATKVVPANSTSFVFDQRVGDGSTYGVTVLSQPAGQTCTVTNGVGRMGTTDINSVQVNCV